MYCILVVLSFICCDIVVFTIVYETLFQFSFMKLTDKLLNKKISFNKTGCVNFKKCV